MKRKEFLREIEGASLEEMKKKAQTLAEELMRLRFKKASGQLEQSHKIKETRRQLARVQQRVAILRRSAGVASQQPEA